MIRVSREESNIYIICFPHLEIDAGYTVGGHKDGGAAAGDDDYHGDADEHDNMRTLQ